MQVGLSLFPVIVVSRACSALLLWPGRTFAAAFSLASSLWNFCPSHSPRTGHAPKRAKSDGHGTPVGALSPVAPRQIKRIVFFHPFAAKSYTALHFLLFYSSQGSRNLKAACAARQICSL
jgi:hypothetical protein